MQYVIMLDRATGNESVGEAWTETKIFHATATLAEVEEWIRSRIYPNSTEGPQLIVHNVRLSTAQ